MRRRRLRSLCATVGAIALLAVSGCGETEEDRVNERADERTGQSGAEQSEAAALDESRDLVGDRLVEIAGSAATALQGAADQGRGRFQTCSSRFPEGAATLQYRAQARVTAGAGVAKPYLDLLEPVLVQNGLEVEGRRPRPSGETLTGTAGDLTAEVSELTGVQGAEGHVLLNVFSACVEVDKTLSEQYLATPGDEYPF